ncbi:MAG: hypothetical protein HIU85_08550 [Proteobacteria bacterium]|nr:hypothetical protein [Pseudomonadota bacterium]
MKVKVIVVGSLLMGCAVGFAQGMGGQGAPAQRGGSAASGSRLQDRDRLSTHSMDRLQDRTQDRTQDRLHDQDRLRDRDRDQDRIYGSNLMSAGERAQYEQRLHSLATEQERVQFRMEHEHEMQVRAEQKGMTLRPAPTETQVRAQEQQRQREREQIYGYSMMSPAEVGRYEERMRSARTEQAREQIRSEHRQTMEAREREREAAAPQQ